MHHEHRDVYKRQVSPRFKKIREVRDRFCVGRMETPHFLCKVVSHRAKEYAIPKYTHVLRKLALQF